MWSKTGCGGVMWVHAPLQLVIHSVLYKLYCTRLYGSFLPTRCIWCVARGLPVCSCRGWGNSLHHRSDRRTRDPQPPVHHSQHAKSESQITTCLSQPYHTFSSGPFKKKLLAHSYLDLALAIIHHAVLGCHGLVGVQAGGIEGHLLHFGYAADGEGLTGARSLVFVPPVAEELLKQSGLSSPWKYLDLWGEPGQRGILACAYLPASSSWNYMCEFDINHTTYANTRCCFSARLMFPVRVIVHMSALPESCWSIPCLWWTADLLTWRLYALTCWPWDLVGVRWEMTRWEGCNS